MFLVFVQVIVVNTVCAAEFSSTGSTAAGGLTVKDASRRFGDVEVGAEEKLHPA